MIGGGKIASRKVGSLQECGAQVRVVAPACVEDLAEAAAAGRLELVSRPFEPGDLDGAWLAVAATDDRGVNEAVAAAAQSRGVLVNVVDEPDLCDFYVPASIRRGDLQITVGTGGSSPVLAKRIREGLESRFGDEYGPYLELLARLREELKARVPDRPRRFEAEKAFLDSEALDLLASGQRDAAERIVAECVSRYAD